MGKPLFHCSSKAIQDHEKMKAYWHILPRWKCEFACSIAISKPRIYETECYKPECIFGSTMDTLSGGTLLPFFSLKKIHHRTILYLLIYFCIYIFFVFCTHVFLSESSHDSVTDKWMAASMRPHNEIYLLFMGFGKPTNTVGSTKSMYIWLFCGNNIQSKFYRICTH